MRRSALLAAATTVALLTGIGVFMSSSSEAVVPAAPKTADGWTKLFQDKTDRVWAGGDQVTSVVAAGHTYWLFGDTMRGKRNPDGAYAEGSDMVSNSILLQAGGTFVNAMADGSQPAVPDTVGGDRYWTQAAVYTGGFLWVFAQRLIRDDSDALGFRLVGVDLVKFSIGLDAKLTRVATLPTPSSGVEQGRGVSHVQWAGDAILRDGYIYVFGYTLAETGNAFVDHWSYLARVPSAAISTREAWQYFKKSNGSWVSSMTALDPGPNGPDSVSDAQVSSVRIIGGKVVMLDKPWNGLGGTVRVGVADNPWGPFTFRDLFSAPDGLNAEGRHYVTYSPQLHPEQKLSNTLSPVLVSIAWNGTDFGDVMADTSLYKPRFLAFNLP